MLCDLLLTEQSKQYQEIILKNKIGNTMRTMKRKLMTIAIGIGMGISFTAAAGQCCERFCASKPAFFQEECRNTCVETGWGTCYLM